MERRSRRTSRDELTNDNHYMEWGDPVERRVARTLALLQTKLDALA